MRFSAMFLCLSVAPAALMADTITASAPITKVTLYPNGASVTRQISLTIPTGTHEVVLPGLPQGTDPGTLRIAAEGVTVGAVSAQTSRALPDESAESDAVIAARAEVRRLEQALRDRDAVAQGHRVRAEAAREQAAFLRDLAKGERTIAEGDIVALSQAVGAAILTALETAQAADLEAQKADVGREDDLRILGQAQARLTALTEDNRDGVALVMTVSSTGAPATIDVTSAITDAGWSPVYDLRLTRFGVEKPALDVERGLMVVQNSGEDWQGVDLTLSTSRPAGQSNAPDPWPVEARIIPRDDGVVMESGGATAKSMADAPNLEVAPVVARDAAESVMYGATVAYHYPTPVNIRSGADALRLKLDTLAMTPEVYAKAVPRTETSAYLTAETPNSSGQVLLPGPASLYVDGVLSGTQDLPLTAAGDDMELGFGPIDGITLRRDLPEQSEGERGILSSSNGRQETAVLTVKNLTDEDWPVRVLDRVPYSTQDALKIDWSAKPAPTETDPEGKRGVLVWETDVAAGATEEIRLETKMRWPEDQVLISE
ncbi:DUF4139 domain-containing protein [Paracoccus pacificus]|uniref:DUF4139 domain-containing protein n=1 Tax=Paracoccus pacificus TaxID=1463598 RepID=A0ABW4RBY5_9RHOB